MVGEGGALAKLQRTLWLARADRRRAATRRSCRWYLLEWDADVARLARRYLHVRPKGPAGTDQRGLYLHKRFFADAGLLATLNGPPHDRRRAAHHRLDADQRRDGRRARSASRSAR